jgi:hypothetical protein
MNSKITFEQSVFTGLTAGIVAAAVNSMLFFIFINKNRKTKS